MGYPVAYRQGSVARPSPVPAFRGSGTGAVIQFPSARTNIGRIMQDLRTLNAPRIKTAPSAPSVGSRSLSDYQWMKSQEGLRGLRPGIRPPQQPFGYAARTALRKRALRGIVGGFKLRGTLARELAIWLFGAMAPFVARSLFAHPQPGWTMHGSPPGVWGLPWYAGQTNAHSTNGNYYRHDGMPGERSGGDRWDGPPFDWMEISDIQDVPAPSGNMFHDYHQCGRGDMGSGPDPRTLSRWWSPLRGQNEKPGRNPYKPAYDPYWQHHANRPGPSRQPNFNPSRDPYPDISPSLDPNSAPINLPSPQPNPPPYRVVPRLRDNPYRSPSERHQRGPVTVGQPRTKENPLPKVRQKPKQKTRNRPKDKPAPVGEPVREPVTTPDPVTRVRRPDGREYETRSKDPLRRRVEPYRDKKPGKRTKEIKSKLNTMRGVWIMRWANQATEWADYIEAIWSTLDRKYKSKGKLRINDKALDIYRHLGKINLEAAVKALVANEIEDYIYGNIGQFSGRAAKRRGGAPIDMAGRTMRKMDTGIRDIVDNLVDRIVSEVFQ